MTDDETYEKIAELYRLTVILVDKETVRTDISDAEMVSNIRDILLRAHMTIEAV